MQSNLKTAQERLETFEALGFTSEADYAEHQHVMAASRALAEKQLATVFTVALGQ